MILGYDCKIITHYTHNGKTMVIPNVDLKNHMTSLLHLVVS